MTNAVQEEPERQEAVRLHHASIGYADVPIIRDIDLTIGKGEAVALLGANGSGKTTLVRGMLGLAAVLAGEVEVLGHPVGPRRDRHRIGYVPQRHTVSGAIPATVREVVGVGRLARRGLLGRLTAGDRAAIERAIAAVGLTGRTSDPVASLSGGQQRRVLVARALAAEPELLIMDEPTAGVDAASQAELAAVLTAVSAAGTTLVVVTHEIGALSDVLTRAVVADHGRVVYDGPLAGAAPFAGADSHHDHDHDGEHPTSRIPGPGLQAPGSGRRSGASRMGSR